MGEDREDKRKQDRRQADDPTYAGDERRKGDRRTADPPAPKPKP